MALWTLSSEAWEGPEDEGGDGMDLDVHPQPSWPECLGPAFRCPSLTLPSVRPSTSLAASFCGEVTGMYTSHAFPDSQQPMPAQASLSVPPQMSHVQARHSVTQVP